MDNLTTTISKAHLGAICADAISELERAIRKHPHFPSKLSYLDKHAASMLLDAFRDRNDNGRATGTTIFEEEFNEFLLEVFAGRPGHAREELVQAIAMLLRIYCHLGFYTGGSEPWQTNPVNPVEKEEPCSGCVDYGRSPMSNRACAICPAPDYPKFKSRGEVQP